MRFFKKKRLRPINVRLVQADGSEVKNRLFPKDILRCVVAGERFPWLTLEYAKSGDLIITQRMPIVHFSLGELRGYIEREAELREKEAE